jgi:hypothetical protein
MRPIQPSEILDLASYERERVRLREAVIALKRWRRVTLGPELSLLFENRLTVLFQVQEMLRAERLSEAAAVRAEIDTYNRLLPGPGELAATLFVEIAGVAQLTPAQARVAVERFRGLDRDALWLKIGPARLPAAFEEVAAPEERVAAVRYLRFAVPEAARRDLAHAERELALEVEHPACRCRAELAADVRAELLADLAADAPGSAAVASGGGLT